MNPRPQTTVYLAYVIPNPTDATLYYPQAVIRNSQSGKVVATVNLTQDANLAQRYTGNFQAPADSTGSGYYLDIVTTVYTDSGHTSTSQNYFSDVQQMYVYQPQANYGGYSSITPKAMRELVAEELKGIKFPEQEKVEIPAFPTIPAPEKVDLEPIHKKVDALAKAVQSVLNAVSSLPEPEKLAPVLSGLERVSSGQIEANKAISKHADTVDINTKLVERMHSAFLGEVKRIEKELLDKLDDIGVSGVPLHFTVGSTRSKMDSKDIFRALRQ